MNCGLDINVPFSGSTILLSLCKETSLFIGKKHESVDKMTISNLLSNPSENACIEMYIHM